MSNSGVFVSGLITYSLSADADCSLLFFSTPLHSPLVSLSYLQPFPYSLVNCSFLANSGLPDALRPFPRSSLPIRSSSLWLFVCVWVWIVFKYGYVSHGMIFGENGSGSWKECLSSSLVCLSGVDTISTFYYDYSTPISLHSLHSHQTERESQQTQDASNGISLPQRGFCLLGKGQPFWQYRVWARYSQFHVKRHCASSAGSFRS